jgi:hypothetical protein
MASDYDSNRFSIELMKTGERIGSWGDVTNLNWESISSAIGSRSEIDIASTAGVSSNYDAATGVFEWRLPDDTSPDAANDDSASRASYVSVKNPTMATLADGIVKLRISGNVTDEKVDRFYFIKNSLAVFAGVPIVPIVLQVYNANDATFVSVAEGSTVAVSLSSTITPKIVDITNNLQVGKLDFTSIPAGSADIFIKGGETDSLKVTQVNPDRSTKEVYSIDTTKGVTSVALSGTTGGYGNNGTYDLGLTLGGGTGAKGTFDVLAGTISNVTITAEGEGYTSAPTIDFEKAQGVKTLTTTTPGSGYSVAATIDLIFGGSPDVAATGTVVTDTGTGTLGPATITSPGAGYTSVPSVSYVYSGPGGTSGVVTAVISSGALGTATIAEASVLDLTGSTTKITKGVIEQSTIGAATPLSGKFTTLESTGNTTIGSSATDTIDITGLIDGPIAFKNDADITTNIGSDTSRAASIVAEKITVNEAGIGEVEIDFKSGGDPAATSPGTTTELKGRVFTDGSDASVNLEASKGMTAHGGIGLKIEDTTRKAYIVRSGGTTGLSSVTLTAGGTGYTPDGLNQTTNLLVPAAPPTTAAILLYDVIGGVVSNMRLDTQGTGYTAFPDETIHPIPGGGSSCTYTTSGGAGLTETEIGSLEPVVAQFLGGGIQNASYVQASDTVGSLVPLDRYVEIQIPCTIAAANTIWGATAHGATIRPKLYQAYLRYEGSDTAPAGTAGKTNYGWQPGDEMPYPSWFWQTPFIFGSVAWISATECGMRGENTQPFQVPAGGTSGATGSSPLTAAQAADWNIYFRMWW